MTTEPTNETPTPVEEPAIVQRMRDVCAVQRNEYGRLVLSTEIGNRPQGALGTLDEYRALLSHLDRLASGTGERDDYYELYCSLNTQHTKQFRQLAEVLSERDSLRSELATAKRELEHARADLHGTRAALQDRTKELESARSHPVVPTGERPSDEELVRVAYNNGARSNPLLRDVFDAGVARGISIGRGDLTRAVLTAETNLIAAKENERVARARADEAHLRAVEALGIQPAEPKASHAWIDEVDARICSVCLADFGTHEAGRPCPGKEPKAEPVCGRCTQCRGEGRYLGPGGWENVDCSACKGTGKQEQATTGNIKAGPTEERINSVGAARPIERLTREGISLLRRLEELESQGVPPRAWTPVDRDILRQLVDAAERDLASAEKEGGEELRWRQIREAAEQVLDCVPGYRAERRAGR